MLIQTNSRCYLFKDSLSIAWCIPFVERGQDPCLYSRTVIGQHETWFPNFSLSETIYSNFTLVQSPAIREKWRVLIMWKSKIASTTAGCYFCTVQENRYCFSPPIKSLLLGVIGRPCSQYTFMHCTNTSGCATTCSHPSIAPVRTALCFQQGNLPWDR